MPSMSGNKQNQELFEGVTGGDLNKMLKAIDAGADTNAICNEESWTGKLRPLHVAVLCCPDEKIIKLLLENGASRSISITPSSQHPTGLTPEQFARIWAKNASGHGDNKLAYRREHIADIMRDWQNNMEITSKIRAKNSITPSIPAIQVVPKKNSINLQPTVEQGAAIFTALFLMGAMLAIDGEKIADDKYRLAGKGIMSICCIVLVMYLTQQAVNAKRETLTILTNMRRRAGLLSDAFTETIIDGGRALQTLNATAKTANQVLNDLGNTAGQAIVQIKDEIKGTFVQLRGDSSKVADAINKGIQDRRFQPQAQVNAIVNVTNNIDVDINNQVNAGFSIF